MTSGTQSEPCENGWTDWDVVYRAWTRGSQQTTHYVGTWIHWGKRNAYTCSWSMSSTLLAIGGSIDAASGYQHCSNLFPTSLLLSSICGFFSFAVISLQFSCKALFTNSTVTQLWCDCNCDFVTTDVTATKPVYHTQWRDNFVIVSFTDVDFIRYSSSITYEIDAV